MAISATGFVGSSGTWVDGTLKTNPSDTAVLADTGALTGGTYQFQISGSGSANWVYDIQLRNAANDTTVYSLRRTCAAGNEDFVILPKLDVSASRRLRLVLVGGVTGNIHMAIFHNQTVS